MAIVRLREKGWQAGCQQDWPLFYMNDFSTLGLLVQNLDAAATGLKAKGYEMEQQGKEARIRLAGGVNQLQALIAALRETGVFFESADLVACVYQG